MTAYQPCRMSYRGGGQSEAVDCSSSTVYGAQGLPYQVTFFWLHVFFFFVDARQNFLQKFDSVDEAIGSALRRYKALL